jgi:hypothetical protein
MDIYSAIIGSGYFFIAARQWAFYRKRIYWRLYLDKSKVGNIFEDVIGDDPVDPVLLNKGLTKTATENNQKIQEEEARRSSFMESIISGSLKRKSKRNNGVVNEGHEIRESEAIENTTNPKSIACEGYLMKKIPSNVSRTWEKLYYILNFTGVMAPFAVNKTRVGNHQP